MVGSNGTSNVAVASTRLLLLSLTTLLIALGLCMTGSGLAMADESAFDYTNLNSFVSDDANVISDDTRTMVNGLNVKYSGYSPRYKLVIATRSGDVPEIGLDMYRTDLYNQLGVDNADKAGILILLMPDANRYAVTVGDGVPSDLRTLLTEDYFQSDGALMEALRSGQYNNAMEAMINDTDTRLTGSFNDWAFAPSAEAYKAQEKASIAKTKQLQAEEQSKTSTLRTLEMLLAVLFGAVLVIFGIVAVIGAVRSMTEYRMRQSRYNELYNTFSSSGLSNAPGLDNPTIESFLKKETELSKTGNNEDFLKDARRWYVAEVLPSVLAAEGTGSNEDYTRWASSLDDSDRVEIMGRYGVSVNTRKALSMADDWLSSHSSLETGGPNDSIGSDGNREVEDTVHHDEDERDTMNSDIEDDVRSDSKKDKSKSDDSNTTSDSSSWASSFDAGSIGSVMDGFTGGW